MPPVTAALLDATPKGAACLEAAVVWWCGVAGAEADELAMVLAHFAGSRYPDLQASVTHLVSGARATPQELQAARDHAARHRGVHAARPDWLRLCAHERRLVPLPDERCSLALDIGGGAGAAGGPLARSASAAGLAEPPAGAAAAAGVFSQAATARTAAALAADASRLGLPGVPAAPDFWDQPAPAGAPERLFADCWFTTAALAGDRAAEAAAHEAVRGFGGRLFTSPAHLPAGATKKFAICPYGLPTQEAAALERTNACFACVHPQCRVTVHWLHTSWQRKALVAPSVRNPLLSPLPHRLPLAAFARTAVSVTGYAEGQKLTIKLLVEKLGGRLLATFNPRDATHLVVATLAGANESTRRKVALALKRGRPVVTVDWLLQSAHAGRPIGVERFFPEGPLPPESLAAGATQMAPSQLGATQAPAVSAGLAAPPSSRGGGGGGAVSFLSGLGAARAAAAAGAAAAGAATGDLDGIPEAEEEDEQQQQQRRRREAENEQRQPKEQQQQQPAETPKRRQANKQAQASPARSPLNLAPTNTTRARAQEQQQEQEQQPAAPGSAKSGRPRQQQQQQQQQQQPSKTPRRASLSRREQAAAAATTPPQQPDAANEAAAAAAAAALPGAASAENDDAAWQDVDHLLSSLTAKQPQQPNSPRGAVFDPPASGRSRLRPGKRATPGGDGSGSGAAAGDVGGSGGGGGGGSDVTAPADASAPNKRAKRGSAGASGGATAADDAAGTIAGAAAEAGGGGGAMPPPAARSSRRSKRGSGGATAAPGGDHPGAAAIEMSQPQVGYDVGQNPSERLRARATRGNGAGGGGMGGGAGGGGAGAGGGGAGGGGGGAGDARLKRQIIAQVQGAGSGGAAR